MNRFPSTTRGTQTHTHTHTHTHTLTLRWIMKWINTATPAWLHYLYFVPPKETSLALSGRERSDSTAESRSSELIIILTEELKYRFSI